MGQREGLKIPHPSADGSSDAMKRSECMIVSVWSVGNEGRELDDSIAPLRGLKRVLKTVQSVGWRINHIPRLWRSTQFFFVSR